MWGILIGIASGALQYFLLLKFTKIITGGKFSSKAVVFGITQFLLPFAVLVLSAILLGDVLGENFLMWIGIGMAVSLITCAVIRFIIVSKRN